jgi:peptide chain release factor 3
MDLLDELERVLGLHSYPVNWPLGSGSDFRGVYDRRTRQAHFFERVPGGAYLAPVEVKDLHDPSIRETMNPAVHARAVDEIALLDGAGAAFDREAVLAGTLTPVFFGSAVNNFGVQLLLDSFLDMAPAPLPRPAGERLVAPEEPGFSGFVFKIQANLDPKHRDRIAFVRVCSGRFERDMAVVHTRTGKKVRLSNAHRLFGRERESVDVAYPGDVVGLVGRAEFHIGDTLATEPSLAFDAIPAFAPECFAWLHGTDTSQFKRFRQGIEQLLQEGVVQQFELENAQFRAPFLGAVGQLQFEVLQYRLQSEYGAATRLEPTPWTMSRWIVAGTVDDAMLPTGARLAKDGRGRPVVLFLDRWGHDFFLEKHPQVRLSDTPPGTRLALSSGN